MKQPDRPHPGSRIVDRVPVHGKLQEWPSNNVRYISQSWRGPMYIQSEGIDFNLRYAALHEHAGRGSYPRHHHPHSEFMLVLDGEGNMETDKKEYEKMSAGPGDLFVLPPRFVHQTTWNLKPKKIWRMLMVDFDSALDIAGLPLESGEHADLAFSPFYQWFFITEGLRMTLEREHWAEAEPIARGIIANLEHPRYGVGAELLSGVLRLIALFSRVLKEQKFVDGKLPALPQFSRHSALLKARNLMEHRGWFDPGCVGKLAREVGMSLSHFVREFHSAYGLSPKQYSQKVLMRRACSLLQATDLSIKDIADRLGYDDPSIFSRAFSRSLGVSPAKYRRENGF